MQQENSPYDAYSGLAGKVAGHMAGRLTQVTQNSNEGIDSNTSDYKTAMMHHEARRLNLQHQAAKNLDLERARHITGRLFPNVI